MTSTESERRKKEDRRLNDGVQASQNSTLKKKDTRISKVKSSISGATGIHSLVGQFEMATSRGRSRRKTEVLTLGEGQFLLSAA